jgi:hypothetical protein
MDTVSQTIVSVYGNITTLDKRENCPAENPNTLYCSRQFYEVILKHGPCEDYRTCELIYNALSCLGLRKFM